MYSIKTKNEALNNQIRHYTNLLLRLLSAIQNENTHVIKEVAVASPALIRLHAFDLIRILVEGEQFKHLVKTKQVTASAFIRLILDQGIASYHQHFFEINTFVLNNLWILGLSEVGAVSLLTYFLVHERFLSAKALMSMMNKQELNSADCQLLLAEHLLQASRFNRHQEVAYLFSKINKGKEKIRLLALREALCCAGFESINILYPEGVSTALQQVEYNKHQLLIDACKRGSLRFLTYALEQGADPNYQEAKALMILIRISSLDWEQKKSQVKGHEYLDSKIPQVLQEMLELLIQAGVHLRAKDDKALALAIYQCHPDLIIYILSKIYPESSIYLQAFKESLELMLSETGKSTNELRGYLRNQISLKVKRFIDKLPDAEQSLNSKNHANFKLDLTLDSPLDWETDTDNSTISLPSVLTPYVGCSVLTDQKDILKFNPIEFIDPYTNADETCDSPLMVRTLMSPGI